MLALLLSPLIGFVAAAAAAAARQGADPQSGALPRARGQAAAAAWIRGLLVLTCTGVSFAHGSNDGQKGMGLIMLVLIGLLPATFALHLDDARRAAAGASPRAARAAQPIFDKAPAPAPLDDAEAADRS